MRVFALLCALLCFAVILTRPVSGSFAATPPSAKASVISDDTSADLGEWLADALHQLPHISWQFQLVGDDFNPSETDYLRALIAFVIPFACVGALLFVACIGYTIFRFTCMDNNEYRFQKWHRTFFRVTLVFITLLMILACGPGIWGSVEVTRSGPYIADRVQQSTDFLVISSESVWNSVELLRAYLNGSYAELTNARSNALLMQDDLHEYKDDMLTLELVRHIVSVCVYGGIAIACVLGMLAALFGWGAPSLMMVFMLWLLLSFSWLLCGIHMAAAVGSADYCQTGDDFFQDKYFKDNNMSSTYVEYYMYCNSSSPYIDLQQDGIDLYRKANQSYYEALAANDTVEAEKWLKVRNNTSDLLFNLDLLASCVITSEDYAESKAKLCSDALVGLSTMIGMWIVIGILGFFAVPIGIAGYRQFPTPQWYEEFGSELVLTREEKHYYSDIPPINMD